MKGLGGKGVVALSVVLGLATSYMVYRFMDQASAEAKPEPTIQVLTAAKDIPSRTVITEDMLRVTSIPVRIKLPQALTSAAQVTGKVAKMPITQGEQVLSNKLFGEREESGLSFVVPPGKRAVAVAVNEVVGSGGMIVPGDSVDVVAVVDTASQNGTKPADPNKPQVDAVAQYVLQNVEVLAVAQQIEGDPAPANAAQKAANAGLGPSTPAPAKQDTSTQAGARSVTLSVDPGDAERLVLAEDKGHIRLVLRAHGDQNIFKTDDGLFVNSNGVISLREPVR